jgi:hypothetical protein
MTTSSKDIRQAYKDALTSYHEEQLQGAEQKMFHILQRLNEVFEELEYHHIPVQGELAVSEPLDAIFKDIYDSLFAAVSSLSALDAKVESALAEINRADLSETIAGLKAQMASRMLRTRGAGMTSMTARMDHPITLDPTGEENLEMEVIELSNPDAFNHPVLGSLQTHRTTPIVPIPINIGPQAIPTGPHAIQLVARNRRLTLEDLNVHLSGNQHADGLVMQQQTDVEATFTTGSATLLNITAHLRTPSIVSLIETPFPEDLYVTVELHTVSGDIFRYSDADPVIFVDNPDFLVDRISWQVDISTLPEETLGGYYYGFLNSISGSNGTKVYAFLVDTVATALAEGRHGTTLTRRSGPAPSRPTPGNPGIGEV